MRRHGVRRTLPLLPGRHSGNCWLRHSPLSDGAAGSRSCTMLRMQPKTPLTHAHSPLLSALCLCLQDPTVP